MNAKAIANSMILLAAGLTIAGCATAPKASVEPHPDTPAYNWKPLFAKDLSDAEFEKGAWRWEGDVLRRKGSVIAPKAR